MKTRVLHARRRAPGTAVVPAVLLALSLLAAYAAPVVAQEAQLNRAFRAVADDWARGDAARIARRAAADGISLDISKGPVGPLSERQVAAMLRRLFDNVETVSVSRGMLERVGGDPPRAFGSLTWTSRPRGIRLPVRTTVYFALSFAGDDWRLTEIRLIQ